MPPYTTREQTYRNTVTTHIIDKDGNTSDIYVRKEFTTNWDSRKPTKMWAGASIQQNYRLEEKSTYKIRQLIAQLEFAIEVKEKLDLRYPTSK